MMGRFSNVLLILSTGAEKLSRATPEKYSLRLIKTNGNSIELDTESSNR